MSESIHLSPISSEGSGKQSFLETNVVKLAHECELIWNARGRADARLHAAAHTNVERLTDSLSDSSQIVRVKALFILSFFETPLILEAIKTTLKFDSCPIVRHEAAYFLGNMQCQPAIDSLGEALLNDPDEIVRHEAAEALGEMGVLAALPWLHKAKADLSPIVRDTISIAESLVKSRNENVVGN